MLTRLPKCSLVPTLPLEEARSKLGFLFRLGSKMTDRRSRCSLRLPQRVRSKLHLPTLIWDASSLVSLKWSPRFRSAFARTHASSTWLSSLHRRARCPPNVHSGVLWSHRCAARLWWFNVLDFREFLQVCPSRFDNVIWRGWVLALCHGCRNSTHLNRLWIFSSLVSNTLNECPCRRCCRGLRGRFTCGRHWNWWCCLRPLHRWCSFSFCFWQSYTCSFCGRSSCCRWRGLLDGYCYCCCRHCVRIIWQRESYSWDRSHQNGFTVAEHVQRPSSRNWCRFPRIPHHDVQEVGVPTTSFHSAFQCTAAIHAIRCSDQTLICFAVTSEANAFESCWFQLVDQCSWSSARNCLSNEWDWVLVRHVSDLLVRCCCWVLSLVESCVLPCCVLWQPS